MDTPPPPPPPSPRGKITSFVVELKSRTAPSCRNLWEFIKGRIEILGNAIHFFMTGSAHWNTFFLLLLLSCLLSFYLALFLSVFSFFFFFFFFSMYAYMHVYMFMHMCVSIYVCMYAFYMNVSIYVSICYIYASIICLFIFSCLCYQPLIIYYCYPLSLFF